MKYTALLDCNNFFVSCERLFRPDLRHRPVVVLSSNDGCIVARSQEIKDKGIAMGVPYFQIKDTLEEMNAAVFSSHLALYRDISRRVLDVVKKEFREVEQYSIDECFFTFESKSPLLVAERIKKKTEALVGVPVSVGVAASKTQAKYASVVAKKTNGTAFLDAAFWQREGATIKLPEIWGVGGSRAKHFQAAGLQTVADLCRSEPAWVGRRFGLEGVRLQAELQGRAVYGICATHEAQKTLMSTRSFAKTTDSLSVLEDAISYHLYEVVKDLEEQQLLATGLRVLIAPSRHGDYAFYRESKEAVLSVPTKDIFVLKKVAYDLLKACFQAGVPYKKAGVVLFGLCAREGQTDTLFPLPADIKAGKTQAVSTLLFGLNKKLGGRSLQLGRIEVGKPAWATRREALSPAYTTRWSDLKVVKTK